MWKKLCAVLFAAGLLGPRAAAADDGFGPWRKYVVPKCGEVQPRVGIRITYLGVNGYLFETGGHALLVDPYFTRAPLGKIALNLPIKSDRELVARALAPLPRRIDAVLVTHGHFDHLLDVPEVIRQTGARLVASDAAVSLVKAHGLSLPDARRVSACAPARSEWRSGPWKVRALPAAHDRILGVTPYPSQTAAPQPLPHRPKEWIMGEPLAFLIEAAGRRIYIDAGGLPDAAPPDIAPVDLAIVGVALPDSRRRLPQLAGALLPPRGPAGRPRYFLPSHQDDFFRPLARGFSFGLTSNFFAVERDSRAEKIPGQLILLDYYRPWTLR